MMYLSKKILGKVSVSMCLECNDTTILITMSQYSLK